MDQSTLKREVAAVLQDVPNHSLPLFKFREMFEKRYRRGVSTSDLYRMREVVTVSDSNLGIGLSGRMITLQSEWIMQGDGALDVFCRTHPTSLYAVTSRLGWAEKEIGVNLPHVEVEFCAFSARIGSVLNAHHGEFPLFSFLDCYGAQFGILKKVEDGSGVPLEHLIASVHGVEIAATPNGIKRVQWKAKQLDNGFAASYEPISSQLLQLSRELIDLLKTMPRCSTPFSKLIPAYHHHFGRQLRVADYCHVTLCSLLQTMPNTIQVLGEGLGRIVTLAHRAQMKRFASDTFRVLKSQPGIKKQLKLEDFEDAFGTTFPARTFAPEDYGLCYFSDLVHELVENFSMVTMSPGENGEEMLAIPKREQSPYEVQKMQIFAAEVVELLSHSIRCEMQFSKFIPSYHHHFGKQCRVSDYGFSKLAELFDAISDTLTCENPNPGVESSPEEKIIRLTPGEQVKVVGSQIRDVVVKRFDQGLLTKVTDLEDGFILQHGFSLRPELCGASDLRDLLTRKVFLWVGLEADMIRAVDEEPRMRMTGEELLASYTGSSFDLDKAMERLTLGTGRDVNDMLKRLQTFEEEIKVLLQDAGGHLGIQCIEQAYCQKYGRSLNPGDFGCHSLIGLLQSIPNVAMLRGKFRTRRVLVLNKPSASQGSENRVQPQYRGKHAFGPSRNQEQQQPRFDWNSVVGGQAPLQQSTVPPPLFSPIVPPSQVFRPRDTNIFNFEQPTALNSPPVYDMWMGDAHVPQGSPPPASPSIVWTYHPFCYPPPPGSPNLFIPSFSYPPPPPWNSSSPSPSLLNPPRFDHEPSQLPQSSA